MQTDVFEVQSFPSLAGFAPKGASATLRVLIATEEIVGPVRNGGIASTYYHLARGLAKQGHEVTILYLKGAVVENETLDHWIDHYRELGIELIYLPELDTPLAAASVRWQWRWTSFYRWLRANDRFDVVHTSEWRGGAFYCLQAKRLGLAFGGTLFIVKASSPYLWNRHYQMRPVDDLDLVVASFAEQKCIEWADMVVGGSAHLLSFMDHIGYRLPEGRTYVQPNIVDFSEINVEDRRPRRAIGDIVETRELVFFGRLEPRKGLDLFIGALDALAAKDVPIERVTFLGKEGERMLGRGRKKPLAAIQERLAHWPFPVDIVTHLNQPEALSLICSRDMIAVMPSLIENSTMAVYEALQHRIPFVATDVGGTPELIADEDRGATLVEPSIQALAERLESVLSNGQVVAGSAFDHQGNLDTWYAFHRYLAERRSPPAAPDATRQGPASSICQIFVPRDSGELERLVLWLDERSGWSECLLCLPFSPQPADRALIERAAAGGARVIEASGASIGDCFNRALAASTSDILVFCGSDGVVPSTGFHDRVAAALHGRPADLVTSAFLFPSDGQAADTLFMPLGGDVAAQSLTRAAYGIELVAGRRETFGAVGPFADLRVSGGTLFEFLGRALVAGRELFVIPEPLLSFVHGYHEIAGPDANRDYLVRRALLEDTNIAATKLLLADTGGAASRAPKNSGGLIMAGAHRAPGELAWLTNVERLGRLEDKINHNHSIFLGFDRKASLMRIAVRHSGELSVLLNREELWRDPEFDSGGELEILEFPLLDFLESRKTAHLRIELLGEPVRAAGVAVQQLDDAIFYVSSHKPIYWGADFDRLLKTVEEMRARRLNQSQYAPATGHRISTHAPAMVPGEHQTGAPLFYRARKRLGW